ncbi:MAG: hypothetical protein Q7T58_03965 [Methylotenera sp.]|nr:hypothetical protein [Methylotenera sp.]
MANYPSNMQVGFGVAWFLCCVVAFSDAGFNMLLILVALPVALIWGMVWLIRLIVSLKRQRSATVEVKRSVVYWLAEPVIVLFPLVLALTGVFSSARFVLSERALSDYVEQVRAGKVDLAFEFNHPRRQVGLYSVTFTDLLPDGTVRMLTSSHGLLDRAGFANSSHTPPSRQGEDSYEHIHQQWWYWYESW